VPIRCIITPSTVRIITSDRVYINPSTVRIITGNRVYITPSTVRIIIMGLDSCSGGGDFGMDRHRRSIAPASRATATVACTRSALSAAALIRRASSTAAGDGRPSRCRSFLAASLRLGVGDNVRHRAQVHSNAWGAGFGPLSRLSISARSTGFGGDRFASLSAN